MYKLEYKFIKKSSKKYYHKLDACNATQRLIYKLMKTKKTIQNSLPSNIKTTTIAKRFILKHTLKTYTLIYRNTFFIKQQWIAS